MHILRRSGGHALALTAGLFLAASTGFAAAAEPEQVTIRFLASQGGLAAHELADACLLYTSDAADE